MEDRQAASQLAQRRAGPWLDMLLYDLSGELHKDS